MIKEFSYSRNSCRLGHQCRTLLLALKICIGCRVASTALEHSNQIIRISLFGLQCGQLDLPVALV